MPKKRAPSKPPTAASAPKAVTEPKRGETVKNQAAPAHPTDSTSTRRLTRSKTLSPGRPSDTRASLPAQAALSFLRDTKGSLSWSLRDLSQTLGISHEEAEHVVALLQIQGYVQPGSHRSGEWMTTPSGETVSGAKPPRFDRETVEAALTSLKQRIQDTNKDRAAKFQIKRAVAFGDFLARERVRAQAADVGIELARKDQERSSKDIAAPHSAVEAREEQLFLRQLRGRTALINLKPYAEWMGTRTHEKLF